MYCRFVYLFFWNMSASHYTLETFFQSVQYRILIDKLMNEVKRKNRIKIQTFLRFSSSNQSPYGNKLKCNNLLSTFSCDSFFAVRNYSDALHHSRFCLVFFTTNVSKMTGYTLYKQHLWNSFTLFSDGLLVGPRVFSVVKASWTKKKKKKLLTSMSH